MTFLINKLKESLFLIMNGLTDVVAGLLSIVNGVLIFIPNEHIKKIVVWLELCGKTLKEKNDLIVEINNNVK